jgi:hypothetical protein
LTIFTLLSLIGGWNKSMSTFWVLTFKIGQESNTTHVNSPNAAWTTNTRQFYSSKGQDTL